MPGIKQKGLHDWSHCQAPSTNLGELLMKGSVQTVTPAQIF